jgi:tripartite-type tricarboxylate transporter receptor subunit TctC
VTARSVQVKVGSRKRLVNAEQVAQNPLTRALPSVPTFDEAGIPGMDASPWFGLFLPANAPAPIVERLNREIDTMLRAPEMIERLVSLGADPAGGPPEALARVIRSDHDKWSAVIKRAGVKLE